MKKTNLSILIDKEIKKDPPLEGRLKKRSKLFDKEIKKYKNVRAIYKNKKCHRWSGDLLIQKKVCRHKFPQGEAARVLPEDFSMFDKNDGGGFVKIKK